MAEIIRTNTVSLTTTRDNVKRQLDMIVQQIENLTDEVQALNNMWEGEAHEAYAASFAGDLAMLSELAKALSGIVAYESNAVTEYNKCEREVASLVAGIRV